MFDNIYAKSWEGSNTTKALVDGAEVRYVVIFVSDGANCAVSCGVYHAGEPGENKGFSACVYGQPRQF